MSDVVYALPTGGYADWTIEQREFVEAFLRDHDIEPNDVGIDGNELVVRILGDGSMELSVWVWDGEDGKPVICPHCPACVRQKRITVPVRTALPLHPDAYIAEQVAVPSDGVEP